MKDADVKNKLLCSENAEPEGHSPTWLQSASERGHEKPSVECQDTKRKNHMLATPLVFAVNRLIDFERKTIESCKSQKQTQLKSMT